MDWTEGKMMEKNHEMKEGWDRRKGKKGRRQHNKFKPNSIAV